MALNLLASVPSATFNFTSNGFVPYRVQKYRMEAVTTTPAAETALIRRSANYQPPIWGYDYIQSLGNIFSSFRDEKGNFKSCLGDDCKEILALYKTAYLLVEEESSIFDEIINFTTTYLKKYVQQKSDGYLSTLVNHALEIPLHWRMLRLEARWFIIVYQRAPNTNPILLDLAKLEFNIAQATHQEDLKSVSRWWKKMGLGEKMSFSRDILMENFFWTVGIISEPQYRHSRRMLTKVIALVTIIDDVYDIYGTLDELEQFTDVVTG